MRVVAFALLSVANVGWACRPAHPSVHRENLYEEAVARFDADYGADQYAFVEDAFEFRVTENPSGESSCSEVYTLMGRIVVNLPVAARKGFKVQSGARGPSFVVWELD